MYAGGSKTFGRLACGYFPMESGGNVWRMFMFGSMVTPKVESSGRRASCMWLGC